MAGNGRKGLEMDGVVGNYGNDWKMFDMAEDCLSRVISEIDIRLMLAQRDWPCTSLR